MLIEINVVDGQYASIDPAYVVWAKVHERSDGGWVAVVRCSTGSGMCSSLSSEFGPFEDKAEADAIVRRVTEATNTAQTSKRERESEFVEFVNQFGTRTAVRRDAVTAISVLCSVDSDLNGGDPEGWSVEVSAGGWASSERFDTKAEADELFDRLTR